MYYGLTNSLGRNFMGSRGDADASAYIDAVIAAGATVSAGQRGYINDFYVSAKADSYYTSLKRLYLPIWGVAAANAIDMIGGTSGTFNGGVTHGAGFVQGNGSTGYFDTNSSPQALGLTNSTGLLVALVKSAPSGSGFASIMGSTTGGITQFFVNGDLVRSNQALGATVDHSGVRATNNGIYVSSRESNTSIEIYSRKSSGITKHATNTDPATGDQASALSLMAQDTAIPSDGEFGAFAIGLGLADLIVEDFTLHLKTLWEGCTSLSLP